MMNSLAGPNSGGTPFFSEGSRTDGAMQGLIETPVGRLFLSETNMNALQDAIRYRVYVESGGQIIGRQSDAELSTVMRSILFQNARGDRGNGVEETRALNALVLAFCVPRVVRELNGYLQYRKDASKLIQPIEYGQASSIKGRGDKALGGREFL